MNREHATKWLPAMGLVMLAHAGAWYGFTQLRHEILPPKPLPVIEVALLPPPTKVTPKPPEPPKPQPKPKAQPRAKPEARPLLQPQPVAERIMEQAPEPAPVAAAQVAPVIEAPARAEPAPVVEAPRFNAAYLNNPPPAYPLAARRRGIEGRVLVRAEIQADGSCSRVELKKTSGFDPLDQAALEAVRKWHFVPAKKGAQAVTAWVEVPITFKLEN
ncbi:MAG: energy transducer TonB [Nitrosomonadales bacterium]|nr:MAG: energy transducer TonB [Nitrosomonadales bacterium]